MQSPDPDGNQKQQDTVSSNGSRVSGEAFNLVDLAIASYLQSNPTAPNIKINIPISETVLLCIAQLKCTADPVEMALIASDAFVKFSLKSKAMIASSGFPVLLSLQKSVEAARFWNMFLPTVILERVPLSMLTELEPWRDFSIVQLQKVIKQRTEANKRRRDAAACQSAASHAAAQAMSTGQLAKVRQDKATLLNVADFLQ